MEKMKKMNGVYINSDEGLHTNDTDFMHHSIDNGENFIKKKNNKYDEFDSF